MKLKDATQHNSYLKENFDMKFEKKKWKIFLLNICIEMKYQQTATYW